MHLKRRSNCPLSCTLDLVGDRWTLLIVRDLHHGRCTFDAFLKSNEGIATNILSDRLDYLCRYGLVKRARDPDDGRRYTYSLTRAGEKIIPLLHAIYDWGKSFFPNTGPQAYVKRRKLKSSP